MTRRAVSTGIVVAAFFLGLTGPVRAEVVGRNIPAAPLTEERVAGRSDWTAYLQTSAATLAHEKAVFSAEVPGPFRPLIGSGSGTRTMPLKKPREWYASAEARHIADVIVSFQTPAGGWSKNSPRDGDVRQPGQFYVSVHDDAEAARVSWSWVNTFDNGATITEMQFLARVAAGAPGAEGARYRDSFLRGMDYIFAAQYPNGGWPQVYPLEGSYHDAITYNDNAMIGVVALLTSAAAGQGDFSFVPASVRAQARSSVDRAIDCILATQVNIDGHPSVWGQQYDALTLQPAGARNYEPPSLSSAESAGILLYLMSLDAPSPGVVAAVDNGISWLKGAALRNSVWVKTDGGYRVREQSGAPFLWSRYYSLTSSKPIFGDRDLTVHDDVMDLSAERRDGYAWFNTGSQKALDTYESWRPRFSKAN